MMKRAMLFAPAFVAALALPTTLAMPAARAGDGDAPAALRGAVKTLAAERHGVVAFHRHYTSSQSGGGMSQVLDSESARVYQDGRPAAAKLYHRVNNGVAAPPEEIARRQAALDKNPPGDDYALPLTESALADFHFGTPAAERGVIAIPFTSTKRDETHEDGTVFIDDKKHHILRFEFRPSALPKEAESAEITVTLGQATSDLWDVVSIKQHFSGHVGPVQGTLDVAATHTAYHRFNSLDEARSKLAAGL
jgi:hypothetical protein